jgi:DNA (cytosine-5)-methyltransferase 1
VAKILNLYAGIGGNRKHWSDAHDITAVEIEPEVARVYKDTFPSDTVIVGDAHQFLLDHFREYDVIWSSPPCPSHGQCRQNLGVNLKGYKVIYPDMELYQEIILLTHNCKARWVVENTVSYYKPLIEPQKVGRHYFWSNMEIAPISIPSTGIRYKSKISQLEEHYRVDLSGYNIPNKRQVLRNCAEPLLGLHVLGCVMKEIQK